MEFRYAWNDGEATVRVEPEAEGLRVTISRPDREPVTYRVTVVRREGERLVLTIEDRPRVFRVARDGKTRWVAQDARAFRLEPPNPRGAQRSAADGSLTAVMPGKVLDVLVQPGQRVGAGAPLVILEAMKMELRITAPSDGEVVAVFVRAGDVVNPGQRLVEVR
ncbi:MAG: biotin/lipoyl-binding protein [Caldilineales bacterium]|nr:biotin/lipoyl-binding protein [Caldilineales bacterium]MCX7851524.1 biotin/lipoyl-binding protein [Caldilineales bacterium]